MSRRIGARMLGAAALTATVALTVQLGVTPSNASWNDREWTAGTAGTITDCIDPEGLFATRGEGKALGGSLLGIDLDTVAEVSGVEVSNNGARAAQDPASADPAGPDAYANPLDVGVLSLIDLNLSNILQLPLDTDTGVLGQYAQAQSNGRAAAAAGYVTESGGIALEPSEGYPDLATLKLSTLLDSLGFDLGTLLAGVADVSLEIGAVTGRATIDGCADLWGATDAVVREYLVAALRTQVTSPTVEALSTSLRDVVGALTTAVNGLAGDQGVLDGITGGLSTLLGGVLGTLGLGDVGVTLTATLDQDTIDEIIATPISDSGGVLSIDIASGTVTVDTAALLDKAYPAATGSGLNGLPPNFNPLADPVALLALQEALTSTLDQWVDGLTDRLLAAVVLDVQVQLELSLLFIPVLELGISVTGPLGHLEAKLENSDVLGVLPLPLDSIVNPLLAGLPALVDGLVRPVLSSALEPALTILTSVTRPVITLVSTLYNALFLDGIVAVTLNAQNDPASGNPEPAEWASLPDGQYAVSALRVGVLDALGNANVRLHLGTAVVGPACSAARAPVECAEY